MDDISLWFFLPNKKPRKWHFAYTILDVKQWTYRHELIGVKNKHIFHLCKPHFEFIVFSYTSQILIHFKIKEKNIPG